MGGVVVDGCDEDSVDYEDLVKEGDVKLVVEDVRGVYYFDLGVVGEFYDLVGELKCCCDYGLVGDDGC